MSATQKRQEQLSGHFAVGTARVLLALLVVAGPTMASTLVTSCGQDLNIPGETYELGFDLTDCPDHGLIISADDVTLDCGCYTIDGDDRPRFTAAIIVFGDRATITDCRLQQFHIGIWDDGAQMKASWIEILDMHEIPADTVFGAGSDGCSEAVVMRGFESELRRSHVHDTCSYAAVGMNAYPAGINPGFNPVAPLDSVGAQVEGFQTVSENVFEDMQRTPNGFAGGTVPFGGYGVAVFASRHAITDNRMRRLKDAAVIYWGGDALTVARNIITDTTVPSAPPTGDQPASGMIQSFGALAFVSGNTIKDNDLRGGAAIVFRNGVFISSNEIDNGGNGINFKNVDLSTMSVFDNNIASGGVDFFDDGGNSNSLDPTRNYYGGVAATTNNAAHFTPLSPTQPAPNQVFSSAPESSHVGITLGRCGPLEVRMESFTVKLSGDGVLVEWTTAAELDSAGFNVLSERGKAKGVNLVELNDVVIPALGNELEGATYHYVDSRKLDGLVHYYLEEVDIYGKVTRYGPMSINLGEARKAEAAHKVPR